MKRIKFWQKNHEELTENKVISGHPSKYNAAYLNIEKQMESVQRELDKISQEIETLENDPAYKTYQDLHDKLSEHLKNKVDKLDSRYQSFKVAMNAFSQGEEVKQANILQKHLEKYEEIVFKISDLREKETQYKRTLNDLTDKLDEQGKKINRNDSDTVVPQGISHRDPNGPVKTKNPLYLESAMNSPRMPNFRSERVTKEAEDAKSAGKEVVRSRSYSN